MNIYKYESKKKPKEVEEGTIILLGAFELFHKGHGTLLNKAFEVKNEKQKIGLVTFLNVEKVFRKNEKKATSLDFQLELFCLLKIDFVILVDFDQVKNIQAFEFMEKIKNKYNANLFICGKDYKLGKNGEWDEKELSNNYKTLVLDLDLYENTKISTTKIKELISYGEIDLTNKLLVKNFGDFFEIVFNKIKFLEGKIIPHSGIYNIKIEIGEMIYHGLLHISLGKIGTIKLFNYEKELKAGIYKIIFCYLNRIIVSSILDKITEEDFKDGISFFYENKN